MTLNIQMRPLIDVIVIGEIEIDATVEIGITSESEITTLVVMSLLHVTRSNSSRPLS
jgi:Tfp pilus assembly ATPase PilU